MYVLFIYLFIFTKTKVRRNTFWQKWADGLKIMLILTNSWFSVQLYIYKPVAIVTCWPTPELLTDVMNITFRCSFPHGSWWSILCTHTCTHTHSVGSSVGVGCSGRQPGELCNRTGLWLAERTEVNRTSQPSFYSLTAWKTACTSVCFVWEFGVCVAAFLSMCSISLSQFNLNRVWGPTGLYKACCSLVLTSRKPDISMHVCMCVCVLPPGRMQI